MEKHVAVDRFEDGELAVLVIAGDNRELIVPISDLPPGTQPGYWLAADIEDGQLISAAIDEEQTKRVRSRIGNKLEQLRRRGRKMDAPSEE